METDQRLKVVAEGGRKLIEIAHHVDDYECMWNGIEDIYMAKTGEKVPSFFFFAVAGLGNFVYMRSNKGPVRRQAVWNDGRVAPMYGFMKDIVGFDYKHIEGRTFAYAMKKAKQQIDGGNPVVLGCLDMYYLSYYPKFYGKEHIPIHFILMVGYDEDKQCALVTDCGLRGVQEIGYDTLEKALDIKNEGLFDKNTICLVQFNEHPHSVIEIAREGFKQKAELMLHPPVGFLGIPGMRKLAGEIDKWPKELSREDYEASLRWMAAFSGTVPSMPARLTGEKETILRQAAREKLSHVLMELGGRYDLPHWQTAASLFLQSGKVMEKINDELVSYLLQEQSDLHKLPKYIEEMADLEEEAFKEILK